MALTLRELEVVSCASTGATDKEIAAELGVAEQTVKTHMKKILLKLNARNRTHAVAICLKAGLI